MRDLKSWLDDYAKSHQNPTNKKIHMICVPLIMYSILGVLVAISSWAALIIAILGLLFYYSLSLRLGFYMMILTAIMLGIIGWLPFRLNLILSIAIFIISWIFQFIGHKIEGKKPSFFKDLLFLLIGPLWVVNRLVSNK
ncbi:MAG: DUF962 domain-containing protein [Francisellaceae bacterium]